MASFCSSERFTYVFNFIFWLVCLLLLALQMDLNTKSKLSEVQTCLLDAIGTLPVNISEELKNIKKRNIVSPELALSLEEEPAKMFLKTGDKNVYISFSVFLKINNTYVRCVEKQNNHFCGYLKAPKHLPSFCYIYISISSHSYFCFSKDTHLTGLILANVTLNSKQTSNFVKTINAYHAGLLQHSFIK